MLSIVALQLKRQKWKLSFYFYFLGWGLEIRIFKIFFQPHVDKPQLDMEKGEDMRTLSAEIFEYYGNFLIVEDYAPLISEENLFLVEMFYETFNIWHIYSL